MNSAPPAYPSMTSRPPSYHASSRGVPRVNIVDEKARLIAADPPTHPIESVPSTTAASQPIATASSTLQPWSKVAYPAASQIPEASWKAFVTDLRNAVAPSGGQKALAVLAGTGIWIGTCCLPLGAVVGALVWKRAVQKNLAADLVTNGTVTPSTPAPRRTIHEVVDQYNTLWQPFGVRVRVEPIDKVAQLHAHLCQCNKEVEFRQGFGGKMTPYVDGQREGGCCGRKCKDCGKWRGKRSERLRDRVRKHIAQVIVEKIDNNGVDMGQYQTRERPEVFDEKQDWVKVEGKEE